MKGIDILKIGLLSTLGFLAPMLLIGGKDTLKHFGDYLPDWSAPPVKVVDKTNEPATNSAGSEPSGIANPDSLEVPEAPVVQKIEPEPARAVEYNEAPKLDLQEVLRFDITPAWVVDRWPRVSAAMPEMKLQGYRVPLITGAAMDDIAGALTYYFDSQKLQRITFRGTTGDFRKISGWLATHYGFVLRPTESPGVIVYEKPAPEKERAESFLWIQPSRIFTDEDSHRRFDLTLVLKRPGV
jgi:hypothetical protein